MNLKTRSMVMIGLSTALMAVFSQIAIPLPMTSVPITLQVFGVMLISMILDKKFSSIALIVYALLGAIGVPVFANFSGGAAVLFGPTGGYIIGFIFMAFIIGFFKEKENKVLTIVGAYLGLAVEYAIGVIQLKIILGLSLEQALISGLYPFIVKDIIMVAIGVIIGEVIYKRVKPIVAI